MYEENKEEKKIDVALVEVGDVTVGALVVGLSIHMTELKKIFDIAKINHCYTESKIPSPDVTSISVTKNDMDAGIDFHKTIMEDIPKDTCPAQVELNLLLEKTLGTVERLLEESEIDIYVLITTDYKCFDIKDYLLNMNPEELVENLDV